MSAHEIDVANPPAPRRCAVPLLTLAGLSLHAWWVANHYGCVAFPKPIELRFALLLFAWLMVGIGIRVERVGWLSPFARLAQLAFHLGGLFLIFQGIWLLMYRFPALGLLTVFSCWIFFPYLLVPAFVLLVICYIWSRN